MTELTEFAEAAAALLGTKGWSQEADQLEPWLTDWRGRFHGRALALASPASTTEVAALVKLCAQHGVPLVPQGGNSGMSGGATPDPSGRAILLSLRRMNAIRSLDPIARRAVCEAGVILQNLDGAAEAEGLRFPLSLGGKGSATVGGLVSTNAGGTQVLRHGSMRALVLGIEAVLADGSVLPALTPLKKDNRGFDLKQLLIGSEGTLGIVTAATLRLLPAVAQRAVVWAGLESLHRAQELLRHCEDAVGDALEGFEVLPQSCLEAVLDHIPGARAPLSDPHAWHALIEVVADRSGADTLAARTEAMLASAFEAGLVEDAAIAASEAQAEAFWLLRESIAPAERARGVAMQHDISVPVERMAAFVEAAVPMIEAEFPGTEAVAFGHLGDGNVHFHVIAPPGSPREWEAKEGKAISRRVHDLATEWGGSISAEHGIGQLKRDELERLGDPVALELMRRVKQALDPRGILNPGKLIALAPPQALSYLRPDFWLTPFLRRVPMASAPQAASLPLFYNDLIPLNSQEHAQWRSRSTDRAQWLAGQHAVPLTVEEFPQAQRHFPIIFSAGENSVPLALMGLNEGVNVFVDAEGKLTENVYVPAYVRRYPFLLAKLTPDANELSLCFDPTSDLLGDFEEGTALFDGGQPSEACKATLGFCEQFEQAGQRTSAFMDELNKHGLLMDGEVAIQQEGKDQPFVYRGFQMIDENKLREVRGDVLRGWNQSGLLPLVFAHLFSLELMRDIFARQVQQGKGPEAALAPAAGQA